MGTPEWTWGSAAYPAGAEDNAAAGVELRAGQQLAGIELKLPKVASFRVSGQAGSYVPDPGTPQLELTAIPLDGAGEPMNWERRSVRIPPDGKFSLRGMPPGRYWLIESQAMRRKGPIGMVTVTDHDLDGVAVPAGMAELRFQSPHSVVLDLQPGVIDVELTLAGGTGKVTVTPESTGAGDGKADLTAVLLPLDEQPGQPPLYSTPAGEATYTFQFIPPGDYRAFLVEAFDEGLWRNRRLFPQLGGAAVTLTEKGSVQVRTRVVSSQEIEAASARLAR